MNAKKVKILRKYAREMTNSKESAKLAYTTLKKRFKDLEKGKWPERY